MYHGVYDGLGDAEKRSEHSQGQFNKTTTELGQRWVNTFDEA